MLIRAGYRLAFECAQPTPTLLVLNVHPSRRANLLSADVPKFDPPLEMWGYIDGFGNACSRVVMPAGRTTCSTEFEIYDDGLPEIVPRDALQHEIKDLPDEVLVFLLGSRYCDTDRLGDFAWSTFGQTEAGWSRVKAICDFVHGHIVFNYANADPLRTAYGGFVDRTGVCRDFAHLAITLCRCMNIPARYCTGYLGDIGVPADPKSDGLQRMVRSLPRGALVHVRRAAQHATHRAHPDGHRTRRDGCRDLHQLRCLETRPFRSHHGRGSRPDRPTHRRVSFRTSA
jgi:hypothetical protein